MSREGFLSAVSPLSEDLTTNRVWSLVNKVWQKSGIIGAGVTAASGGYELQNMWQTSGSGNLTAKIFGKLMAGLSTRLWPSEYNHKPNLNAW